MPTQPLDPRILLDLDPYLRPNVPAILHRHNNFRMWKDNIEKHEGGYEKFTKGYLKLGFNVAPDNSVVYREWAPNATAANLIGDFSEISLLLSLSLNPLTFGCSIRQINGTELLNP